MRCPAHLLTAACLVVGPSTPIAAQAPAAVEAPSFVTEGVVDAPLDALWRVWTTAEGYKALGPKMIEVDFRLDRLIRAKYAATGTLDDPDTIVNRIVAFEPRRMIALRIERPPAGFPFKEAWKHTWTVITLTPEGPSRTHVRVASLGFASDPESVKMRQFFEAGNAQTLDMLRAALASRR